MMVYWRSDEKLLYQKSLYCFGPANEKLYNGQIKIIAFTKIQLYNSIFSPANTEVAHPIVAAVNIGLQLYHSLAEATSSTCPVRKHPVQHFVSGRWRIHSYRSCIVMRTPHFQLAVKYVHSTCFRAAWTDRVGRCSTGPWQCYRPTSIRWDWPISVPLSPNGPDFVWSSSQPLWTSRIGHQLDGYPAVGHWVAGIGILWKCGQIIGDDRYYLWILRGKLNG